MQKPSEEYELYISELLIPGVKPIYPLTSILHLVEDCCIRHQLPHTSELRMEYTVGSHRFLHTWHQKTQSRSKKLTVLTWDEVDAKQIRVCVKFLAIDIIGIKWANNNVRLYTKGVWYNNPTTFLTCVNNSYIAIIWSLLCLHKGVKTL